MGTEPQQGLRLGLDEGAPGCPAFCQEPFLGLELLFPGKRVVSPPLLWAPWCDAVSVYSIQRYLSFPFVNYI